MWRYGFLIGVVVSLLLCSCHPSPSIKTLAPDAVVLAFGDSLTAGTGAERDESYPAVLQTLLHRSVVNAGIPGELSGQGWTRLPGVVEKWKPSVVVLCHGGNDLLQGRAKEDLKANLSNMILFLKERKINVVLIGVPEPTFPPHTASLYRELAQHYRLPYEDEALMRILSDASAKSDDIHPNAKGYRQLAEAVAGRFD